MSHFDPKLNDELEDDADEQDERDEWEKEEDDDASEDVAELPAPLPFDEKIVKVSAPSILAIADDVVEDEEDEEDPLFVQPRRETQDEVVETLTTDKTFEVYIKVENIAQKNIKVNAIGRKLRVDIIPKVLKANEGVGVNKWISLPLRADTRRITTSYAKGTIVIKVNLKVAE